MTTPALLNRRQASSLLLGQPLPEQPTGQPSRHHAQHHRRARGHQHRGEERALSQRMAKAFLQMGMQVDTQRSTTVLNTTIGTFDRQLTALQAFAPPPPLKTPTKSWRKTGKPTKPRSTPKTPSPKTAKKCWPCQK